MPTMRVEVDEPAERDPHVVRLRELHIESDSTTRAAFAWRCPDRPPPVRGETPRGMRFTVSPETQDELFGLDRERNAAEVAAGVYAELGEAKAKRSPRQPDPGQEAPM